MRFHVKFLSFLAVAMLISYMDARAVELSHHYRLTNIRIYDRAELPDGFDESTKRMRSYSGYGYKYCIDVR